MTIDPMTQPMPIGTTTWLQKGLRPGCNCRKQIKRIRIGTTTWFQKGLRRIEYRGARSRVVSEQRPDYRRDWDIETRTSGSRSTLSEQRPDYRRDWDFFIPYCIFSDFDLSEQRPDYRRDWDVAFIRTQNSFLVSIGTTTWLQKGLRRRCQFRTPHTYHPIGTTTWLQKGLRLSDTFFFFTHIWFHRNNDLITEGIETIMIFLLS